MKKWTKETTLTFYLILILLVILVGTMIALYTLKTEQGKCWMHPIPYGISELEKKVPNGKLTCSCSFYPKVNAMIIATSENVTISPLQ